MAENIALTEGVYYILLALETPLHGYGIMQKTEEMSGGRVRLAAGTLYGALSSLVKKGWIKELPEGDSRRREYAMTELGNQVVREELERLEELVQNGQQVLKQEAIK